MVQITRILLLFEWLLLGLSGGALVIAHVIFLRTPLGLPMPRVYNLNPLSYLPLAVVPGALAVFYRERFLGVFFCGCSRSSRSFQFLSS